MFFRGFQKKQPTKEILKTQVTFATGDGDLRSPRRDLRRRREEPCGTGTAERRQLLGGNIARTRGGREKEKWMKQTKHIRGIAHIYIYKYIIYITFIRVV